MTHSDSHSLGRRKGVLGVDAVGCGDDCGDAGWPATGSTGEAVSGCP